MMRLNSPFLDILITATVAENGCRLIKVVGDGVLLGCLPVIDATHLKMKRNLEFEMAARATLVDSYGR
jgi:hypothetical protein